MCAGHGQHRWALVEKRKRDLAILKYLATGFLYCIYQYFNNNISSSSFNPSDTHVLPFHHISSPHHISSHSLIGMDDYLSSMYQRPRPDHTLKPREGRRTPLTSQVKLYLGKVDSRQVSICIVRSTRNSAEVYTTHKITIIDDPGRLGW
jgi:hypothetical protein